MDAQDKQQKQDEGTRKRTSETTKNTKKRENTRENEENQKARQRREKTSNGSESIHHRPHVVITNTLKPQHNASQTDSGRFMVFDVFSANVIENQPILQQTHRLSGRVERWRGGVGEAYLFPPLSSGGASIAAPRSVSTSRSSNRTCGFTASGSRTRSHAFAHGRLCVCTSSRVRPNVL